MKKLPKYKQAPIVEVSAAIRTTGTERLKAAHVADFWQAIGRQNFPVYDVKAPLPVQVDRLRPHQIQIQFSHTPDLGRQWFTSEDGSRIIQLQRDLLAVNWIKRGPEPYPHFPAILSCLMHARKGLIEILEAFDLGHIGTSDLELIYVNHIPLKSDSPSALNDETRSIFPSLVSQTEAAVAAPVNFNLQWEVPINGRNIGQIHLLRVQDFETGEAGLQLRLSVTGQPDGPEKTGLSQWFEAAHEWIVTSFDGLVSEPKQKEWGRYVS